MIKFCNRLRFLRSSKGLSQMELAKLLHLSKSSINMYERGEREPSFKTLESFADFFNVDMDYLLGKTDVVRKYAITPISTCEISPSDVSFYQEYRELPRDDQETVQQMVHIMHDRRKNEAQMQD